MAGGKKGSVSDVVAVWLPLIMQTDGLAVILDLHDLTIAAISDALRTELGAKPGQSLIGESWYDFLAKPVSGGLEMMARGVIEGFEARTSLTVPGQPPRQISGWLHVLGEERPARYGIAVIRPAEEPSALSPPDPSSEGAPLVFGIGDRNLVITHLTADAVELLGVPADQVLGKLLLSLFDQSSVPAALWVLAQALQSQASATGHVRIPSAGGKTQLVDFMVCGLHPSPTFGFALIPKADPLLHRETDTRNVFRSVVQAERATAIYRQIPELHAIDPGLIAQLTFRELEVVALLLRGHRTPAIAKSLYLSQSTVRNHLSSVFAKAGVSSQQELLEMLRSRVA